MCQYQEKWDFSKLVPILEAIENIDSKVKVVVIEGRCGSGKTTLAKQLSKITGGEVISMDHFFLPAELRTEERFREIGGNIHYERFAKEVLPVLKNPNAFFYQKFDCRKMSMGEKCTVSAGVLRIVEGVYGCHPYFGDYMDLRVFCDVSSLEQRRRLLERDGADMLERYMGEWVPREEKYFKTFHIKEKADIIV